MATIAISRKNHSSNGFLVFVALAILAFLAVQMSAHAWKTHGTAALNAAHCFDNGQVMQEMRRDPLTGRTMKFCIENGHWFIKIDFKDGNNLTMFPRSFAKCLRDVIDYAIRSGYTEIIKDGVLIP